MKTILVPVDFSECSIFAVEFAANLVRRTKGELYLLHVLDSGGADPKSSSSGSWAGSEDVLIVPQMIGLLRNTRTRMKQFITENNLEEMPVQDVVEVGEPTGKIILAAQKYEADLIVMGTHGVSGIKELFIGSVAEKVAMHADRPVLSIRERTDPNPSVLIFASDFSEEADPVFNQVKNFAAIYNATIHLVKVTDSRDETAHDSSLTGFIARNHVESFPHSLIPASSIEAGLLEYASRAKAGMIALGTHGRRGVARFFNGSISGEMVNHSFCPVLTINFRKKTFPIK